MSLLTSALPPKTGLNTYRVLSPKCGLRCSPLQLGGMSLGGAWEGILGKNTKENSLALLDKFWDLGGNFIDTANNYQDQESEVIIGEWMKAKGNRDQMIIATKYTTAYKWDENTPVKVNHGGNHYKSMFVEDSLKKLQTTYIDILYLHWWDYTASIEEVMQGLNNLIRAGKVLYLGISDTPAWIVSRANEYARQNGLAQFVIYQGYWGVNMRDLEREIIPMCLAEGMALAPWGAAGRGRLLSKDELEKRKLAGENIRALGGAGAEQSPDEVNMSAALEKIAGETGTSIVAVAIAWALQKFPYVFPIIGGRKIDQLEQNVKALSIALTDQQMEELGNVVPFKYGFPFEYFGRGPALTGENFLMKSTGHYAWVKPIQAIKPSN